MEGLEINELAQVNGGTKYQCTYCGYKTTNMLKMSFHFGTKTWHYLLGGRIKEI